MYISVRSSFLVCAAVVLSCLSGWSQEPKPATPARIPAGLHLSGRLKTNLVTKNCKVGDPVELELTEPVTVYDGNTPHTLANEHAHLFGTVTMARKAAKDQTAAVAVHFVEIRSKTGTQPVDAILDGSVLVSRDNGSVMYNATYDQSTVESDTDMRPLEGASINSDPTYGSVLSSKHNLFLLKGGTELSVVTR
jgi:hypothetical protein